LHLDHTTRPLQNGELGQSDRHDAIAELGVNLLVLDLEWQADRALE
jgi:hypothetical protein